MAGKKMKLTPEMNAFSKEPLHMRTVQNWRESVVGLDELRHGLAQQLNLWMNYHEPHMQDILYANRDAVGAGFIMTMIDDIYVDQGWFSNVRIRFTQSSEFEINHSKLHHFMEMPLEKVEWATPDGVKLMLLLLTYRTFIQEKFTPIPGLPFNITIPGCVYTCFRLGIGVEA